MADPVSKQWPESFVTECFMVPRATDDVLFVVERDGTVRARLHRYLICPLETPPQEVARLLANVQADEPASPI